MASPATLLLQHIRKLAAAQTTERLTDRELLERFAREQDETAFTALLRRHGPMVLRVCQRLLPQSADVEDVFQATFLLLVRKATGLRRQESVGNWLYGVAYRLALKARRTAVRRRAYEGRAQTQSPADPLAEITLREAQTLFDEALNQLPEKCRAPLVLCYLEGLTQEEAARQLGCSLSTLKRYLESGRERLRKRLACHRLTLTSALLAAVLSPSVAEGALGRELTRATVKAVVAYTGKNAITGVVSVRVVALVEGGLKSMFTAKQIVTALVALGIVAGSAGVILSQRTDSSAPDESRVQQPEQAAKRPDPPVAADGKPPPTDRSGDPLPEGAIARLGTVRFRHGGYITWLTFTPDGKQLVSHGYDAVRIWDADTGQQISQIAVEPDGWIGAAFLTDEGKTVVTMERGQQGNVIRLRNRSNLKVVREFDVGWLQMPRLSPDGKLLAGLVENNSSVEIWDMTQGKRLRSWQAHEGYMWCHEFSADSKTLITGGPDKAIRFWDVATGEKKREITGHPNVVSKLALSGDGTLLATLGMTEVKVGNASWYPWDNLIRVWDVASGKELRQLTMPVKKGFGDQPQGFHFLIFAPDGKTLVTAGQDDLLRFWNPATGKDVRQMPLGSRGASVLSFSPDGQTLAIGTHAIRLIDLASGKDLLNLSGHHQSVFATATTDGRTVITAAGEGEAVLWDIQTGRERGRLSGHGEPIMDVRLVADGQRLLTSGMDNRLRLWELATGKELRRFEAPGPSIGLLAVSNDGRTLAFRGKENAAILTEMDTGKEVGKLGKHDEWVSGAAFAPDGRTLITWCNDHTAHVWDVKTAHEQRQFEFADIRPQPGAGQPVPAPVGPGGSRTGLGYAAAVSPDGRLIAYGSQAQYLAIHEVLTGKTVRVIDKLQPDGAGTLAFSPDGRMLAWSGWRQPAIHLLELATGKERLRFDGHKGRVTSLTFSANGRTLISGSEDATALVWDLIGKFSRKDALAFDAAWNHLADNDADLAYQALCRLIASPVEAIPYLDKRLHAVPVVDESHLTGLIAELDSNQFAAREEAAKDLEDLGEVAVGACRKALQQQPSAEVRRRLEALIAKQDSETWNPSPKRLRTMRSVEMLEMAGTPQAQEVLKSLARGAPEARLTQEAKASMNRLAKRSSASP